MKRKHSFDGTPLMGARTESRLISDLLEPGWVQPEVESIATSNLPGWERRRARTDNRSVAFGSRIGNLPEPGV